MAQPDLIPMPFAENATPGTIEPIPATTPTVPQDATWSSGFPQVTMQPLASGGIPPRGQNFNGVLNALSQHIFHMQGGGQYKWDDAHGPYSIGDVLQSDDGLRSYVSVVNNNTDNFNTTPSAIGTSWLPWSGGAASELVAGLVKIATTAEAQALANDEHALTPKKLGEVVATQASKGIVELATNTETQAGTDTERVVTPAGLSARTATTSRTGLVELATDNEAASGTDTDRAVTPKGVASAISARKSVIRFGSSGNWTVPAGVTEILVSGVAGGGGGGAGSGYVADRQYPGGGGGAGQSVIRQKFTVTPGHVFAITVPFGGAGGIGQAAGQAGGNGQQGGNAVVYNNSLGTAILTLTGGSGGSGGSTGGGGNSGAGWPRGGDGMTAYGAASVLLLSGSGASSPFGGGGGARSSAAFQKVGVDGDGYGSGGSGGNGLTASNSGPNGGNGANGVIIIEW